MMAEFLFSIIQKLLAKSESVQNIVFKILFPGKNYYKCSNGPQYLVYFRKYLTKVHHDALPHPQGLGVLELPLKEKPFQPCTLLRRILHAPPKVSDRGSFQGVFG